MMAKKSIQGMEFKHLHFAFDSGPAIFSDVSVQLPKSRAIWVRSPGGRGKTTFLKILSGLLTPQSGQYLINGQDTAEMSFEEFLPYRMNMGYGFDMGGLLNNKSLAENLILPLLYHKLMPEPEALQRVMQVTDLFGMHDVREQRPFAVSGSLRKLTCVLRAFIHEPQVVLLDDPLTGLKRDHLNDLYHFIEEGYSRHGLRQIVFTSESPEIAQQFDAEELLISPDWFTSRAVA